MPQAFTREQPRVAPLTATPILVEIEAEYIPLLFSALEKYHNRYFWVSDGDYSAGLQGILRLERALLTNMSESIVTELQRIYRLIDTSFNGTQYTATPAGEGLPPTITPALTPVPPASTDEANAMRAHLGRLWQLGENAATGEAWPAGAGVEGSAELPASLSWAQRLLSVQGVRDTGWITPDQPVTLKMLLEANRINSTQDKDTIRNATTTLSDVVTAGGSIADAIGDFLTAAADAGTDGGVIAVQLATSAALLLQLQRINVAINDNPVLPDGTPSLLFALRGDNVISSSNNVMSLLDTGLSNISSRIGPAVGGLAVTGLLDAIRVAIRSLAGLEAAGAIAAGSALQLQLAVLECICEGVTGSPATFPPFELSECNPSFELVASVPLVPFDAQGIAAPLEFVLEPGVTLTTVDIPTVGLCLFVGAPRELCFQVIRANGEPNESQFGFVCTPYAFDGSGGARPTVQVDGIPDGDSGFFEVESSDDAEPIAYYITLAQGEQQPVVGQYRVYVAGGPVG